MVHHPLMSSKKYIKRNLSSGIHLLHEANQTAHNNYEITQILQVTLTSEEMNNYSNKQSF